MEECIANSSQQGPSQKDISNSIYAEHLGKINKACTSIQQGYDKALLAEWYSCMQLNHQLGKKQRKQLARCLIASTMFSEKKSANHRRSNSK